MHRSASRSREAGSRRSRATRSARRSTPAAGASSRAASSTTRRGASSAAPAGARCPTCLMTVDGVPNVRVCTEPVREGADVRGQNVLGSLDRDFLSLVDRFGGPFTPVGFYYRTMIRPRRLWPLYEKFLRNVAGLGRVDKHRGRTTRFDAEHRRVDVLVIGGGRSGRRAAEEAAERGEQVLLVDENPGRGQATGFDVVAPGRAI